VNRNSTGKIVLLISGNGSNLQAFIDRQNSPDLNGQVVAVISNVANAYGLIRAKNANIPAITIEHTQFASRENFDSALISKIDEYQPDLIVLAGFMRILTANFVAHYRQRLLNIHPSLLPKYPGLHTHKRAIENNDQYHGASVHFVTEELDGGPIIAQSQVAIKNGETERNLKIKVQQLEHQLYPAAANLLLTDRIKLVEDVVHMDNAPLEKPVRMKLEK